MKLVAPRARVVWESSFIRLLDVRGRDTWSSPFWIEMVSWWDERTIRFQGFKGMRFIARWSPPT